MNIKVDVKASNMAARYSHKERMNITIEETFDNESFMHYTVTFISKDILPDGTPTKRKHAEYCQNLEVLHRIAQEWLKLNTIEKPNNPFTVKL